MRIMHVHPAIHVTTPMDVTSVSEVRLTVSHLSSPVCKAVCQSYLFYTYILHTDTNSSIDILCFQLPHFALFAYVWKRHQIFKNFARYHLFLSTFSISLVHFCHSCAWITCGVALQISCACITMIALLYTTVIRVLRPAMRTKMERSLPISLNGKSDCHVDMTSHKHLN